MSPCWERRSITLEMAKADPKILADALRAMGATNVWADGKVVQGYLGTATVRWTDGKLTVNGLTDEEIGIAAKDVRKAYTAQAFRAAATKAGFKVQVTTDGRLVATRTRYGG